MNLFAFILSMTFAGLDGREDDGISSCTSRAGVAVGTDDEPMMARNKEIYVPGSATLLVVLLLSDVMVKTAILTVVLTENRDVLAESNAGWTNVELAYK